VKWTAAATSGLLQQSYVVATMPRHFLNFLKKENKQKNSCFLHSKSKFYFIFWIFWIFFSDSRPFRHYGGNSDGNRHGTALWRPEI